jgi:hypothetical protein
MEPIAEQYKELYRLSYFLTFKMFTSITLVCLQDDGNLVMLAGDAIDIIIYPNGEVKYE